MKTCTRCGDKKSLSEFYKQDNHKDGLRSACKKCEYKRIRKWFSKNHERGKEYQKKWRQNNPDKKKRAYKKWVDSHPEYKEYRKKKKHERGRNKKYKYELGISYTKEYKKAAKHRRALRFKVGGELTASTIRLAYEDNIKRFGTLTCYLCLTPIPFGKDHLEHLIPLSRNGTNEYSNLGVACQRCNCKKRNKTVEEFLNG